MSLFKAKEASTCVSQGLHFLHWCLSAANAIFNPGNGVKITMNRPKEADPAKKEECLGSVAACVEGIATERQNNTSGEQKAPQLRQLLLLYFRIKSNPKSFTLLKPFLSSERAVGKTLHFTWASASL